MLGLTLRNCMIFYYEWKKSKSNLARLCEYMFMMRRLKNQAIQDLHFGTHFGREPEKTSGNCQYKTSNSIFHINTNDHVEAKIFSGHSMLKYLSTACQRVKIQAVMVTKSTKDPPKRSSTTHWNPDTH